MPSQTSLTSRSDLLHPDPDSSGSTRDLPALVRQAADGDAEAFESLYRATSGRVYAVCLRMSADRARAAELTQDVYVRVWQNLRKFRGESAVESWIHRIAVNVVLENERSARRQHARVETSGDLAEVETNHLSSRRENGDDDRLDIEAAIAALPPATRRAFVLHDIEGFKHEEISRMTGTAQGTLRAQLFKARRMLMETLAR